MRLADVPIQEKMREASEDSPHQDEMLRCNIPDF